MRPQRSTLRLVFVLWLVAMAPDLLTAASRLESEETAMDSIILDGIPISIEGQVIFDTLETFRKGRNGEDAWTLQGQGASVWRCGPVQESGFMHLEEVLQRAAGQSWTGMSSGRLNELGWTLEASGRSVWSPWPSAALRPVIGLALSKGAAMDQLASIDPGDSIVGWIPRSADAVDAITFERYPLGVELDTLTFAVERNWRAAALGGFEWCWSIGKRSSSEVRLGAGAVFWLNPACWSITSLGAVDLEREGLAHRVQTKMNQWSTWVGVSYAQAAIQQRAWRKQPKGKGTLADRLGWQMSLRWWPEGFWIGAGLSVKMPSSRN